MNEETNDVAKSAEAIKPATETLYHGLEDSMFKLLNFQAQQGANENSTMIMLALMNLLGIVNCMNKILPEGQRVRGTGDLANQIAGALGGMPANTQGSPGGIDPGMITALAGMLGGPGKTEGGGETNDRPGLDPAMMTTLAGLLGGPGGGGNNPAALMAMLANLLGPKKPMGKKSGQEAKAESEKAEDKSNQAREGQRKEAGPHPRGMLKWDPRFGSPSSSF